MAKQRVTFGKGSSNARVGTNGFGSSNYEQGSTSGRQRLGCDTHPSRWPGGRKTMKSIMRRIEALEKRLMPQPLSARERELLARIEAGRERVRKMREESGLPPDPDWGLPPFHPGWGGAHLGHVSNAPPALPIGSRNQPACPGILDLFPATQLRCEIK